MLITKENRQHFAQLAREAKARKAEERRQAIAQASQVLANPHHAWVDSLDEIQALLVDLVKFELSNRQPGRATGRGLRIKELLQASRMLIEQRQMLTGSTSGPVRARPAQVAPLSETLAPKVGSRVEPIHPAGEVEHPGGEVLPAENAEPIPQPIVGDALFGSDNSKPLDPDSL